MIELCQPRKDRAARNTISQAHGDFRDHTGSRGTHDGSIGLQLGALIVHFRLAQLLL